MFTAQQKTYFNIFSETWGSGGDNVEKYEKKEV
jgi:hypothetical protein